MEQGGGEAGRVEWDLTSTVIAAAIEVHRHLGPGLLESAYEVCLCHELALRNIEFKRQVSVPVNYKGAVLDCEYRIDLLVENAVIVELKAISTLLPIHEAQVLTYMAITGVTVGLLINFNVEALRLGLRRLGRTKKSSPPPRLPVKS
jgi:GxxExxY protein